MVRSRLAALVHGKSHRLGYEFTVNEIASLVPSPCMGNCCLDDDFTCLGCFRSLEEIKEWSIVDDHRRGVILKNAEQRKAARQPGEVSGSRLDENA